MNVIALRGDQQLVDLGNDLGAVYDAESGLMGKKASLASLLKWGYWEFLESATDPTLLDLAYNPHQERDESGKWTSGGGSNPSDNVTVGGISTDIKQLGLAKEHETLLTKAMKSKGKSLNGDDAVKLQEAKNAAFVALGAKMGFSEKETLEAIDYNKSAIEAWSLEGGTNFQRTEYESAWNRLRSGMEATDVSDKAIAMQKAYADITWDTKGLEDSTSVIRGVTTESGAGQRMLLAELLGETTTFSTFPLTSWSEDDPQREANITRWIERAYGDSGVDTMAMLRMEVDQNDVLAIYHSEPQLRDNVFVKGEYIVGGQDSMQTGKMEIQGVGISTAPYEDGGLGVYSQDPVITAGRDFVERTGRSSEDFWFERSVQREFAGDHISTTELITGQPFPKEIHSMPNPDLKALAADRSAIMEVFTPQWEKVLQSNIPEDQKNYEDVYNKVASERMQPYIEQKDQRIIAFADFFRERNLSIGDYDTVAAYRKIVINPANYIAEHERKFLNATLEVINYTRDKAGTSEPLTLAGLAEVRTEKREDLTDYDAYRDR